MYVIDKFKIGSVIQKIMLMKEEEGATIGEAEEIPKYLENAVRKNGEQYRKGAAFTVFKD